MCNYFFCTWLKVKIKKGQSATVGLKIGKEGSEKHKFSKFAFYESSWEINDHRRCGE